MKMIDISTLHQNEERQNLMFCKDKRDWAYSAKLNGQTCWSSAGDENLPKKRKFESELVDSLSECLGEFRRVFDSVNVPSHSPTKKTRKDVKAPNPVAALKSFAPPLGLKLKKSPSLIHLITRGLQQQQASLLPDSSGDSSVDSHGHFPVCSSSSDEPLSRPLSPISRNSTPSPSTTIRSSSLESPAESTGRRGLRQSRGVSKLSDECPQAAAPKGSAASTTAAADQKLKASNFPLNKLVIGSWARESIYCGDLVSKCYFAKRKLVWEILEHGLKKKIEVSWSDICGLRISLPAGLPGVLEVMVARPPEFFKEINPQPRKHTIWSDCEDFTGYEASRCEPHRLVAATGILNKQIKNLLESDRRLSSLLVGLPEHLQLVLPKNHASSWQGSDSEDCDSGTEHPLVPVPDLNPYML